MKPDPSADTDLDNVAKEVNEDIAAGQGEKHFQDLFDEVSASAPVEDPDVRDRLNRFTRDFAAGLNDRLRGNEHGFYCTGMNPDGHGTGFICMFRDKDTRSFSAACSFDDGFEAAARYGKAEMGRAMLQIVIERLIEARKKYFARMQAFG